MKISNWSPDLYINHHNSYNSNKGYARWFFENFKLISWPLNFLCQGYQESETRYGWSNLLNEHQSFHRSIFPKGSLFFLFNYWILYAFSMLWYSSRTFLIVIFAFFLSENLDVLNFKVRGQIKYFSQKSSVDPNLTLYESFIIRVLDVKNIITQFQRQRKNWKLILLVREGDWKLGNGLRINYWINFENLIILSHPMLHMIKTKI